MGAGRSLVRWAPLVMVMPCSLLPLLLHRNLRRLVVFMVVIFHFRFGWHVRLEISNRMPEIKGVQTRKYTRQEQ